MRKPQSSYSQQLLSNQHPTAHPAAIQQGEGLGLTGYNDVSFAPFGGRSYGASAIALNGSVVSWRCGHQAFTTMSVAEAELYEAAQATLLLQGIAALVQELIGTQVPQSLLVDSVAAVSFSQAVKDRGEQSI